MLGLCKNINAQILQVRLRFQRSSNCCEAVSLPECELRLNGVSIKREVEADEEEVKDCSKFLKGS